MIMTTYSLKSLTAFYKIYPFWICTSALFHPASLSKEWQLCRNQIPETERISRSQDEIQVFFVGQLVESNTEKQEAQKRIWNYILRQLYLSSNKGEAIDKQEGQRAIQLLLQASLEDSIWCGYKSARFSWKIYYWIALYKWRCINYLYIYFILIL